MRERGGILIVALAAAIAASGCHSMRFWVADGRPERVEYDWHHFFFWGLTPAKQVDVREHCPGGAVAIREETTFWDGLCSTFTLGIWTPRSSWYSCAAEGF